MLDLASGQHRVGGAWIMSPVRLMDVRPYMVLFQNFVLANVGLLFLFQNDSKMLQDLNIVISGN